MKDLTDKKTTTDKVKDLIQEEFEFTHRYEFLEKKYIAERSSEVYHRYYVNGFEVDRNFFQELLAGADDGDYTEYNQELIEVDDIIEALLEFK